MPFSDNLKALRENAGLTQEQLSRDLDISKSSISMYEQGNREPDFEILEMIADFFNVDMNFLLSRDRMESFNCSNYWSKPLVSAYVSAIRPTQEAACAVLGIPHVEPFDSTQELIQEEETESMLTFVFHSAAGIPLYVEGEFEQRDYPKSMIPAGADFAITIDGDSMEPTIEDGATVFVCKQQDIQNGQIGIFMLGDGDMATCKRFHKDRNGISLLSDNPKYKPIIIGEENEGFRLVGKALGYR